MEMLLYMKVIQLTKNGEILKSRLENMLYGLHLWRMIGSVGTQWKMERIFMMSVNIRLSIDQ